VGGFSSTICLRRYVGYLAHSAAHELKL
jgi:hypothetical protein